MWTCLIVLVGVFYQARAVCKDCKVLNLSDKQSNTKKFIQWEDIFNLTLSPKYAGISWAKKGNDMYESSQEGIWKVDPKTNERIKRYFTTDDLFDYGYEYDISADEKYAIMYKVTKSKYRHSFYANYSVMDLESRKVVRVDPIGNNNVQYCSFSPTGHTLLLVADNDMYTNKDPMKNDTFARHTLDGKENIIFNGIPDWVYEEEVVSDAFSYYPSPDSKYVAFTKTNATGVKHVKFPIYGKDNYATILDYEYPKAGYKNPTIQTWVADLSNADAAAYNLPTPQEVLAWGEHYLYTVSWANEKTVVCEWWNRKQTELVFYKCNVAKDALKCDRIFGQKNDEGSTPGWMDWWSQPLWYFDGLNKFATLLPSNQGIEGNFKHIALYTEDAEGKWESRFITSGLFDVLSIYAQDVEKGYLFYMASKGGQMFRHVFQLDINTGKSTCLSCDGYCGYSGASFSPNAKLYRLSCYGPVTPYVVLKEVDTDFTLVLEANNELDHKLRSFTLPKKEYLTEKIGGFDINIQRLSPPDFDENSTRRYPVLVYVYGGPDSGNVKDTFPYGDQRNDYHNYLANGDPAKPQFLVYYIDVRGTLGRGDEFRFPLYRNFGITEVNDTLEFLEKLRQYHYVDDARIAIWGWSYGGFLTSKVASSGRKLVQAAISVAPVTSFYFYDTIYTERYMSLPTENDNYVHGDVLHEAANIAGTNFFLIHGSADDNVHYTNSARLAFELVENDVQFRMHSYTDKQHSLKGSHTRRHLYTMMRDWLYQVLNLKDKYDYYS